MSKRIEPRIERLERARAGPGPEPASEAERALFEAACALPLAELIALAEVIDGRPVGAETQALAEVAADKLAGQGVNDGES